MNKGILDLSVYKSYKKLYDLIQLEFLLNYAYNNLFIYHILYIYLQKYSYILSEENTLLEKKLGITCI